jgi:predicted MFS family arabinose efflux permease
MASSLRGWKLLLLLCTANAVAYVGVFEIPPIIGRLVKEFHISYAQAGLFMSAYALVRMIGSLLAGALSDNYGVKRLVSLGLLLLAAGGFLSAQSHGFTSMLIDRILIGTGATLIFIPGLATAMYLLRPEQINLATGTFFTSMNFGLTLALLITPIMAASFSWRTPLNIFAGLAVLVAAVFILSTARRTIAPAAPSHAAAAGGSEYAVGRFSITNLPLLLVCIGYFLMLFHTYGMITWLPEYLKEARQYTPTEVGTVSMLLGLVMIPGTFIAGWIGDQVGPWGIGVVGAFLCGICPAALVMAPRLPIGGVYIDITVLALGICLLVVPLTSILGYLVPAKDNGKAVGLVHTTGYAGSFVSTYLGGYLLTRTESYFWTFMLYVGSMVITILIFLPLRRCYSEARRSASSQPATSPAGA